MPFDDFLIPDDVHLLDSEDTGAAHLPKIKTKPDWLKPVNAIAKSYQDPEENKLLQKTKDIGSFIKWYCKRIGKLKLTKTDLEGPAFKLVRPFHKNIISVQFQMEEFHLLLIDRIDLTNLKGNRVVPDVSKPLPLGGPPGQTFTIQDLWLEELNTVSLWIKSNMTKIDQFNLRQSHMKLLCWSVSRLSPDMAITILNIDCLLMADYQNTRSLKLDFKKLHPNDYERLNIVIRHRVEDLQLGMESYQTKLNLTQPSWDASDILFKEDYTIVHKPRVVIYKDRNNQKKIMREFEVHKFSDGTLTRILEQLDHMVKYFVLFKFNPGMKHRIWSEDEEQRVHRGDREKA
ncbi:hypothetical protein Tco_0757952 [Tanacetum coccineum]